MIRHFGDKSQRHGFGPFFLRYAVFGGGGGADVTAPTLSSATIPTGGGYIDLAYNESLDNTSTPATGDFSITVPSGSPPTISGISFQTTSVTNDTVRVSVSTNFYEPEADSFGTGIQIDYTVGSNPIRDVAENNAAALVSQAVTNNSTVWPLTANGAAYSPEGGSLAGFMTDLSGNGNDLVTNSQDPSIDSGTYNEPVVAFGSTTALLLPTAFCSAMNGSADAPGSLFASWYRVNGSNETLLHTGTDNNDYSFYVLKLSAANTRIYLYRDDTTTEVFGNSTLVFSEAAWETVGIICTGTAVTFHKDAALTSVTTDGTVDTGAVSAASTGYLGRSVGGTFYMNGSVGRLVIDAADVVAGSRDHAVLQTWVDDYRQAL